MAKSREFSSIVGSSLSAASQPVESAAEQQKAASKKILFECDGENLEGLETLANSMGRKGSYKAVINRALKELIARDANAQRSLPSESAA